MPFAGEVCVRTPVCSGGSVWVWMAMPCSPQVCVCVFLPSDRVCVWVPVRSGTACSCALLTSGPQACVGASCAERHSECKREGTTRGGGGRSWGQKGERTAFVTWRSAVCAQRTQSAHVNSCLRQSLAPEQPSPVTTPSSVVHTPATAHLFGCQSRAPVRRSSAHRRPRLRGLHGKPQGRMFIKCALGKCPMPTKRRTTFCGTRDPFYWAASALLPCLTVYFFLNAPSCDPASALLCLTCQWPRSRIQNLATFMTVLCVNRGACARGALYRRSPPLVAALPRFSLYPR